MSMTFAPGDQNYSDYLFAIRPVMDLARGSVLTSTPDVKRLTLLFKKTIQPLWGVDVVLDLTDDLQGYSPEEKRDFIESIISTENLQQVTYKDEDDNDQNRWMFILSAQAEERTGHNDKAFWRITLAEANSM